MYTGTSENSTSYTIKTGLAAFKLLAVNPSKQEIEEIIGRELPFEVAYDLREDPNGNSVRPIDFWVKSEVLGVVDKVTFQIGNIPRLSQSNNTQFINAKGIIRYAASLEEANTKYEKMAPFIREVMIGEEALYRFMHCAMGYKYSSPEAAFLSDSESAGVTPKNLYDGNVEGLRKFIDFVNSKNRKVGLVLGAKERTKTDDEGVETKVFRQVILNNPDFFFTLASGSVGSYSKDQMAKVIKEKKENGVSLGTALFTIDIHQHEVNDFKKDICVNNIPENPTTAKSSGWA